MKKIILLDTHAIIHRGFHALGDLKTKAGFPTGGLFGLCSILFSLIENFKPDYILAAKDLPDENFRKKIFSDYKGTRKKTDDALIEQLKFIDNFFKAFSIPVFSQSGFEADDVLGSLAEQLKKNKDTEIIIASGDLDILQLIDKNVFVYTFQKGLSNFSLFGHKEVLKRFDFGPEFLIDYKAIVGDRSDNIAGISGLGDKAAKELIIKFGSLENIYKAVNRGEEYFLNLGFKKRVFNLLKDNKKEADSSKFLVTIKRDLKMPFDLSQPTFLKALEKERLENLFRELEFNTFNKRLNRLLGSDALPPKDNVGQKYLIATHLLNSSLTNPSADDFYFYAKTKNLKEAILIIEKEIKEKGLAFVWEKIEIPLMPILASMKEKGVFIDKKSLEKLSQKINKELKALEIDIFKLAGRQFNIRSSLQLGQVLFAELKLKESKIKKTSSGQFSTQESELIKMKEAHPIIPKILLFKRLQKINSTYVDGFKKFIDKNSLIHSSFLQTGATTGRLASQAPGLQNIPVSGLYAKEVRDLFCPRNLGSLFICFDYSQIELRILAALSGDVKLIKIFQDGQDIHTSVASEIFNIDASQVSDQLRRKAKMINFGILYGMGARALKDSLNNEISLEEAKLFIENYFNKFPQLADFLERSKNFARKEGYVKTFFGRRRTLKEIFSPIPFIKANAERAAVNAPIQGTQADLIKLAMIAINKFLEKEKLSQDCFCIMQIHDELIFEIKEPLIEKVAPQIKKIMEGIIKPQDFAGVPLKANASVGKKWGEINSLILK